MSRLLPFRSSFTPLAPTRVAALAALVAGLCLSPAESQLCDGVAPIAHTGLKSVPVVDSGEIVDPLLATAAPGDVTRLFVVAQDGRIWVHTRGESPDSVSVFLDLRSRVSTWGSEQGLLGLVFDPDYATTGHFWVSYTESDSASGPHYSVVSRFSVSPDPNVADPTSESRVLRLSQPRTNHNGGNLQFGTDGLLYISSGDGGGSGDPHGLCGNGQNLETPLGKILRLDVRGVSADPRAPDCFDGAADYDVPGDNPFVDGAGGNCDEIYAYGLRNPWRTDIDPETGTQYIADVGQDCWEEVNVAEPDEAPGANYGWKQMEGAHCFDANAPTCDPAGLSCGSSPDCFDASLVLPVLEYENGSNCSITGGYVYRGCRMPALSGRYFYGDYCSGFIRSFIYASGEATSPQDHTEELDPGNTLLFDLTSFGRDARGELYFVDRDGIVSKILPLFTDLLVSGPGARPFLLGEDWTWEDLEYETEHPVSFYRVYRALRPGDSAFTCVHRTADATPQWLGGDPFVPSPGSAGLYLITAVSPEGDETASGHPDVDLIPGNCP